LKHYKANLFEQDYYQKYSTIFSICAIRLSENKHKDEILHDAYEWINLQQKENGAWQVYNRNKIHFTLSIVSVFSESIVRLISEKEPLKPISVNNSSINLPQGAKWEEVTIKFLNGTDVKILHNGQLIKETSGLEIGFRPKKGEKDNVGWELLKLLSKQEDNQSSWGDRNAGNALRSQKKSTVRILKKYFKLNSDPFFPYKKIKGYKSRFNLIPESSGNNIYIPPNFDDYKIPDDIARADL